MTSHIISSPVSDKAALILLSVFAALALALVGAALALVHRAIGAGQ